MAETDHDGGESLEWIFQADEDSRVYFAAMAEGLGLASERELFDLFTKDPDVRSFLRLNPAEKEISERLVEFVEEICLLQGKKVHDILSAVDPEPFFPHLDSPIALRVANALGFDSTADMKDVFLESGEADFWVWINDRSHSIGTDVHAEVFGDSHEAENSFEPPEEWRPGSSENEDEEPA